MTTHLPALPDDVVDAELIDDDNGAAPGTLPAVPGTAVPARPTPGTVDIAALPATLTGANAELTPEAEAALAAAGRERTRQTYRERWSAYANWCAAGGRLAGPPTSEANLTSYVTYLCQKDTAPDSVRLAVAAIRDVNARAGHEDTPKQAAALHIYDTYRHDWAETGGQPRSSAPVDLARLRALLAVCDPADLLGLRDRVLLQLGYHMRGRRSELVKLRVADAQFPAPGLLVMIKRTSKNDKKSTGREYEIDDPAVIRDVRAWIAALRTLGAGAPHMPLLRSVERRTGGPQLGPLSAKTGHGLTGKAINNRVHQLVTAALAAGHELDVEPGDITAHGLRAGTPTDLGALGYSAAEIKDMTGDWSSTEMVEKYRKTGRRRAGQRSDEGTRRSALSMLRLTPNPDQGTP